MYFYQQLSEEFIEKFQGLVDWSNISRFQKLSEQFIEKFKNRVDPEYILKYQDGLSDEFKAKMRAYWGEGRCKE